MRVFVLCLAVSLTACVHAPPPPMMWVRTDGQRVVGNPALMQQAEIDKTVCVGDAQKTNLSSLTPVETSKYSWGLDPSVERQRSQASVDTLKGCMAQKGYILVPADQADTVREQFASTAAARMAAQNPPPPLRKKN